LRPRYFGWPKEDVTMTHNEEHVENLLGYALGDDDSGAISRADLIQQVLDCEECLSYSYRILGDLPPVVAALGASDRTQARVEHNCSQRMDELLGAVAIQLAERDAPESRTGRLIPFPKRFTRSTWGLVGMALAAGIALVVVWSQLGRGPTDSRWAKRSQSRDDAAPSIGAGRALPEELAEGYLREFLASTPAGYGFGSAPGSSPFRRGYALGVLRDLDAARPLAAIPPEGEARGTDVEIYELLGGVGVDLSNQTVRDVWPDLRERGCAELAASEDPEDETSSCRWGLFAYQLQRDLDAPETAIVDPTERLRSEDVDVFLRWVRSSAKDAPRGGELDRGLNALEARVAKGGQPDASEIATWKEVIGSLLRHL
jgi:hypothetical protein